MNDIRIRWVFCAPFLVGAGMGCGTEPGATGSATEGEPQEAAVVAHPLEARESYPTGDLPSNALTGKDADKDLIRDDVERFIEERWAAQPKVFLAQRQVARAYCRLIAFSEDREQTRDGAVSLMQAIACSRALDEASDENRKTLMAALMNNDERMESYLHYQRHLSGSALSLPAVTKDHCLFDLAGL